MSDCSTKKSVTLLAVALLGFFLFQMTQVMADKANLSKVAEQAEKNNAQLDKVLAENQKMLDQLNAIAIGTQRLADAGNANAKEIVQQLARLGIKINPNFKEDQQKAAATAPEAPAAPTPTPVAPPVPAAPAPAMAK